MGITLAVVVVVLVLCLGLSTALSWGIKRVGKVIARGREVRPQTRYYMA